MASSEQSADPITPKQLRVRAGRVCVALSGPAMLDQADAVIRETPFIEFRLDSLSEPASLYTDLRAFFSVNTHVIAIATCRRAAHGGAFNGTVQEQIEVLAEAARAGCVLADIEVETAEEFGPDALHALREAGAAVIVSWHDFTRTPDLEPVLRRIEAVQPDFLKIAPTAQSLRDAIRVLDLLEQHGASGELIAMSMGQMGVLTRVLGPRYGSAFTFAAPGDSHGTAPGQIAVSTLRHLYRIDSITPQTAVYAVAGSPIGASLSPLMHNTAFAATGMDAVYLPLETADSNELREVMDRLGIRGLSITMPLKETVIPLLHHADETVTQMQACNTLLRSPDGKLVGFNTDVAGITGPLERVMDLTGKRVLVLGAGGAARAAVFGLRDKGAEVSILNRTVERAEALAVEAAVKVQSRGVLVLSHFNILLNSTPYGMRGKDIEPPITPAEMNCDLFFDFVYNPVETPLVRVALERAIQVIPGVAMFVAQGVQQFFLWTEQTAPEGDMLRAVEDALSSPGGEHVNQVPPDMRSGSA